MDLVAASRDANTLTIFTNNGSGGFVLSFCTGRGRRALVGGADRCQGDGKVDLITANSVANTLTVLPLGITGVKIPAAGQFQFSFDTASGVNYVVQYSTNLNQWFQLITVGGVGLPMTLTDPMGGNRNRFYRILLSP